MVVHVTTYPYGWGARFLRKDEVCLAVAHICAAQDDERLRMAIIWSVKQARAMEPNSAVRLRLPANCPALLEILSGAPSPEWRDVAQLLDETGACISQNPGDNDTKE